ncbi:protein BIG GRAIN 1-like B [Prosopis cineraria]|uniref:protein BIG GRAIN 1-like B n=1 Tax=Prosopis cineraria TaxID=364024 RepID=UPI00240FAAE5|nr:protein BIG GRAIN 1-like B [Prosopis cineraria]
MDRWDRSQRDRQQRHYRENPSFSSTLLDAIYRSIDEGEREERQNQLVLYRETMKKQKQSNFFDEEAKAPSSRRSQKVENWMDARAFEKVEVRRNSIHSSSSSTDSSSNGGFSSSESSSELFNGVQRLKPIRTSADPPQKPTFDSLNAYRNYSGNTQKPKQENGFEKKTKSKALRRILYGDLKKSKQPISPGARLTSFLNSLFNSGGGNNNAKKKPKVVSSNTLTQPSTCSSASSFSRSCLSKTPSSSRSAAKATRSVRFCPVSVIVDEDCRPCGHKNLYEGEKGIEKFSHVSKNSNNEELRFHVMQESRRVEEYARELLRNYQKKKKDVDDDDDAASCSSSDLFELDNLSGIGNIERYREELPVYETTHFNTNRAIANNGFML